MATTAAPATEPAADARRSAVTALEQPASPLVTLPRAAPPRSSGRVVALDLLRFLAILLMLQGHTATALVAAALKSTTVWRVHDFVHGFTAPMFLFGGGLAFGVTTLRRWRAHLHLGPAVYKRLSRYSWMLLIGYALHLPARSLFASFMLSDEAQWRAFLRVDALQVIAVTLLGCELLLLVLRRRSYFVAAVLLLLGTAVLTAPLLWRTDVVGKLPLFLASYFTYATGSFFPLAPWAGFLLTGVLTAFLVVDKEGKEVRPNGPHRLLGLALILLTAAWVAYFFDINPLGEHNFWRASPVFFAFRVGMVMLLLTGLLFATGHKKPPREPGLVRKTINVLAQESLGIYVVHLPLVYGSVLGVSMRSIWGDDLGAGRVLGAFLTLLAISVVFAWGWHLLRARRPEQHRQLRWALALGFLAVGVVAS